MSVFRRVRKFCIFVALRVRQTFFVYADAIGGEKREWG